MKKVCGWIILISAIIVTLTFWISENNIEKFITFMLGLSGIFGGIDLIKDKK